MTERMKPLPKPAILLVSCTHHHMPKYQLDGLEVTVDAGYTTSMEIGWSASIPGFGTSKYYRDAETAVRSLLRDHACTDITIVNAADYEAANTTETNEIVTNVVMPPVTVPQYRLILDALFNYDNYMPVDTEIDAYVFEDEHGVLVHTTREDIRDLHDRLHSADHTTTKPIDQEDARAMLGLLKEIERDLRNMNDLNAGKTVRGMILRIARLVAKVGG